MQQDPVRRELAGEQRPRRSRKPVADGQRTFSFLADDTED